MKAMLKALKVSSKQLKFEQEAGSATKSHAPGAAQADLQKRLRPE